MRKPRSRSRLRSSGPAGLARSRVTGASLPHAGLQALGWNSLGGPGGLLRGCWRCVCGDAPAGACFRKSCSHEGGTSGPGRGGTERPGTRTRPPALLLHCGHGNATAGRAQQGHVSAGAAGCSSRRTTELWVWGQQSHRFVPRGLWLCSKRRGWTQGSTQGQETENSLRKELETTSN